MNTKQRIKFHTNPIQRLAARLLRQENYSVTQVGAMINVTPSVILDICRDLSPDSIKPTTLAEVGAPDDDDLFTSLLVAANRFVRDRRERLQPGDPRGQNRPVSARIAA